MTFAVFAAYAGLALGVLNGIKNAVDIWQKKNERQRQLRGELSKILLDIQSEAGKMHFPHRAAGERTQQVLKDGFVSLKPMVLRGLKSPSNQHLKMLMAVVGSAAIEWEWIQQELIDEEILGNDEQNAISTRQTVLMRTVDANVSRYISALASIDDQQIFMTAYARYRWGKPQITIVDTAGHATTKPYVEFTRLAPEKLE